MEWNNFLSSQDHGAVFGEVLVVLRDDLVCARGMGILLIQSSFPQHGHVLAKISIALTLRTASLIVPHVPVRAVPVCNLATVM